MAIQRNKVAAAPAQETAATSGATSETNPQVIHAGAPASGPVPVPDASGDVAAAATVARKRGGRTGPRGPQLDWGFVINGEVLRKTLVEIAREVSAEHNGYATLGNLVDAVKSHPSFTDNSPDGVPLSDLASVTNVRTQWAGMRDKFIVQFSAKSVEEGGLGLTLPAKKEKESEKEWINKCKALFTDGQWSQMEDQIAKPKPEGLNFPKLAVRRGRRASSLDMGDI